MLSCRRGPRVRDSPLPVQSPFPRFGTLLPPERLQETRYAATKRRTQCLAAVPKRCPAPVARTLTGSLRSHLPRRPRVDPESSALRERSRPLTPSRAPRASHPRATPFFRLPAAPPASRSTDPPPPASSYERSLTLSARAVPTEHREKACQPRKSKRSLRVRLRRTRSKQKGERLRSPSSYDSRIGPTSTRHSRVSVSSLFPVTVSPNCFTAKTAIKKALTGMAR